MPCFDFPAIQLQIQHEEWEKWTECFIIRNVTLPGTVYMGFSAHTGDVGDDHDIISVSSHNVVWHAPQPGASSRKRKGGTGNTGGRSNGGGVGVFLYAMIKWLFFAVILVIGVIVFRGYRTKKSAKRF